MYAPAVLVRMLGLALERVVVVPVRDVSSSSSEESEEESVPDEEEEESSEEDDPLRRWPLKATRRPPALVE